MRFSLLKAEDIGVLLEVENSADGNGCRAKRKPNSNVRWLGSSRATHFFATDRVGLPTRRFCAVDIDGHGTRCTSNGTYQYVLTIQLYLACANVLKFNVVEAVSGQINFSVVHSIIYLMVLARIHFTWS